MVSGGGLDERGRQARLNVLSDENESLKRLVREDMAEITRLRARVAELERELTRRWNDVPRNVEPPFPEQS